MSAVKGSNTNSTRRDLIYVALLGEGTTVYRPVSAIFIEPGVYLLEGQDTYDPEDEVWEFLPGTKVIVESTVLAKGEAVPVAIADA